MKKNLGTKEILLVDDDRDYSELTRTRLESAGYQVSCVSDGREALERLERPDQPHLIIMDLDMPDKNGLTTLINMGVHQARKEKEGIPRIPVVVATGIHSEKVREMVTACNVSAYLKKPYEAQELIQVVKRLIGESVLVGDSFL